jgi:hypothetical protein
MRRAAPGLILTLAFVATCAAASDFNPLGFYVGAAAGQAHVRMDSSLTDTANNIDEHDTGWKATVGMRPLPIVGAEFEYLNFGSPHYSGVTGGLPTASGVMHSRAEALFGILYAPIPLPLLDVFGKLGVARLQNHANGEISPIFCPAPPLFPGCPFFANSSSTTSFAYGAGLLFKFGAAAVRGEYERIEASTGAPDMFTVGLSWTF